MKDKRKKVLEVDRLFQAFIKENKDDFYELLPADITPTQFILLSTIKETANCKAADIAQILCFSPAAVTHLVDRLNANDWVDRVRSEKDRRIVWLKPTKKGQELLRRVQKKRYDMLLQRFANVNEEQLESLIGMLKVMLKK
ncbi:MAG: MarR family winged helix-turn-helix transcriptional regulator [Peptococcaceae bacterium]